eukprot:scaffold1833_cov263-Chaetoceros_neogracile.AAC.4
MRLASLIGSGVVYLSELSLSWSAAGVVLSGLGMEVANSRAEVASDEPRGQKIYCSSKLGRILQTSSDVPSAKCQVPRLGGMKNEERRHEV